MNWPSYLIQVNIYLALFYAFYVLVLQNETFFKWNRIFLVSSGGLSFLIPLMQSEWVKSLFVTKTIEQFSGTALNPLMLNEVQISVNRNEGLTTGEWIALLYLLGVLLFLSKFLWQLSKVSKSFHEGSQAQSFFNKIKVSEHLPSRESIIKHEEVHALQLHSADVIIFELISIINWFNPVVYAYKKSVKYIHEFIADEAASIDSGKSEYALLLVSNAFGVQNEQLTNNFYNQSLLKKRIIMLHKTKSRRTALLKYGLTAPLFAAMLVFSSATINQDDINKTDRASTIFQPEILEAIASVGPTSTDKSNSVSSLLEEVKDLKKELTSVNSADQEIDETIITDRTNVMLAKEQNPRDTSGVYNQASVELMPEYPGGIQKFLQWVGSNYKFPKAASDAEISGRMIVQFVVEKDGTLTDIKVPRDLGFGTGEAAKELLANSVKWKPGIQNGKPVRVQYTLPLMLRSPKKNVNSADSLLIRTDKGNIFDSPNPPLFILDGKEITAEYMKQIKPADILSMEVLKDKSATDKYGEKGKNGVIIIKLKQK